ncbi:MAG: hypothetical protein RLZZ436_3111, partial [Planctomycetota bacterium]
MNSAADRLQAIDDAIEQFEQNWRLDQPDLIQSVAQDAGLPSDPQLIVELIRVDIDRRYAAGNDVDLDSYFRQFPDLQQDPTHVAAICFEDYRGRKQRRRACPLVRWAGYRGVDSEGWFRELQSETQVATGSGHLEFPSTASFLSYQLPPGESSFAAAALPQVSERIGDFELVALLGEGAFSKVYLARQSSLGRRYVAAKVVDRPMQEPYNLSRLQHTGIVPLYSCHEAEGRWVLCMPYSGATTLARWLREVKNPQQRTGESLRNSVEAAQTRLTSRNEAQPTGLNNPANDVVQSLKRWHQAASGPLQQLQSMNSGRLALWIFRRLASALAHAHQRGLVHGDLKPANILIRNDGEPALIDFNLSQSTESRQRAWVGGTMPYLAREQLQQLLNQSAGPPRPEYDIHALGVIMFEILEGRLPFRSANNTSSEELQAALASHEQVPEFTTGVGSIGLRTIVAACIAPGPAGRYPTAVELLADLDRETANQPLVHSRESFWKGQIPKTLRRYPRAFSGGFITAASLMVIGFLCLWLISARQAEKLLEASEIRDQLFDVTNNLSSRLFRSSIDQSSSSYQSSRAVLQAILQAFKCQSGESVAEKWAEVQSLLTPTEVADLRCCVTILTIAAAEARQQELRQTQIMAIVEEQAGSGTSLSNAQIRELITVLPDNLQNNRFLECLLDTPLQAADFSQPGLPENTSIPGLDELLYAIHLADRGDNEAALQILQNSNPPVCLATLHWMVRGQLLHQLGQFREAIAAFSIILNEQPTHEAALAGRGNAALALGRYHSAEDDFTTAVENHPQLADAWLQRGFVRQGLMKLDEAVQDLSEAIRLRPTSNRYHLSRARIYERLKRSEEAEADFRKARELPATTSEDRVARASALIAVDAE